MDDQDQGPNFEKVTRPREAHEEDGSGVMDEHHPKVLAFHINELGTKQPPIKSQFCHVPPPDIRINNVIRIFVPEKYFKGTFF